MIKNYLSFCYSALMFRIEKPEEPKDYSERIANLLSMKFFFILSAVFFNIALRMFNLKNNSWLIILLIIVIALITYLIVSPKIKKYIVKLELPKKDKEKSNLTRFFQIILMLLNVLIVFFLFVFSFVIQRYI